MYCKEMDILTDNSFEISCGIEMSSDEEDMDIDLQDELDTAEVEKICSLYEGIEDTAVPVSDVSESQQLIRLQNGCKTAWLSIKHSLLKNHQQQSYGYSISNI